MPFINTIDINGEVYNLGNLSDGYHIVDLPKSLKRNDIFILQGDVVDSLNDTLEDMPHNKPLSAYQGKTLDEKISAESQSSTDRAATITQNLNDEISRSTNKDNDLDTRIDTEIQRASGAESTLTTNLNSEISRATRAESDLNTAIKALQDSVGAGGGSSTGLFKAIADAESAAKSYADDNFIKQTSIADNLSTNSSDKVLSAKQGKALNDTKVDKVTGKGLSSNDYTTVEKNKLATIAEGANKYVHPTYTVQSSGLYKITVDSTGHISSVVPVSKGDIVALGIPAQDTVYELPQASATEIGGVKIDSDYTTGSNNVAASTSALKTVYESLLARIEALEAQNSDTTT